MSPSSPSGSAQHTRPFVVQLCHAIHADSEQRWIQFSTWLRRESISFSAITTEGQFLEYATSAGLVTEEHQSLRRIAERLTSQALDLSETYTHVPFHAAGEHPGPVQSEPLFRPSSAGTRSIAGTPTISSAGHYPFDPENPSDTYVFVRDLTRRALIMQQTLEKLQAQVSEIQSGMAEVLIRLDALEERSDDLHTITERQNSMIASIRSDVDNSMAAAATSVTTAARLGVQYGLRELQDTPSSVGSFSQLRVSGSECESPVQERLPADKKKDS